MFQKHQEKKMRLLRFFDKYVQLGFKPIAIYPQNKLPIGVGWNQNWSVERWRPFFSDPTMNMGVLLGDIVDVEADSEEANDRLERMIDGIERPKFRSCKSIHNLFINPDPTLQRLVVSGIEFRGYLHQSVFPPSKHESGTEYAWLAGSKFPIPPMPQELKEFYFKNKKAKDSQQSKAKHANKPRKQKKYHRRTQCNCCKNKYYIHDTRLRLEVQVFRNHKMLWLCKDCRPIDIREDCREFRKIINTKSRKDHSSLD
jgi:hypothetical protein